MNGFVCLFGHDPATYQPHWLHRGERTYLETNCYTDILIELLHARGDEPVAVLGATVRMDFEGDQWMFFKPHSADLEALLGVDIHEMQLYRSLEAHIVDQLAQGHTVLVEVDSWYLPDTAATSYRREHVKTSVAVEAIDVEGQRLRYYHNASLYELTGDDYRGALRVGLELPGDVLPPYAETARFDDGSRLTGSELVAAARSSLRGHLDRAPASNPFSAFGERLADDLATLLAGDVADYHAYAFATVRMAGAGFELCSAHVDWLLGADGRAATEAFSSIVDAAKLLGFKLARLRPFDPTPVVTEMGAAWERAMDALGSAV